MPPIPRSSTSRIPTPRTRTTRRATVVPDSRPVFTFSVRDEWGIEQSVATHNPLTVQLRLFDDPVFLCTVCRTRMSELTTGCATCSHLGKPNLCFGCTKYMCADCGNKNYIKTCAICHNRIPKHDSILTPSGARVCTSCLEKLRNRCDFCNAKELDGRLGKTRLSNGSEKRVCKNCASKYQTCTLCSYLVAPNKLVPIDEHKVCPRCLKEHSAICSQCRETHLSSTFIRVNGTSICRKCFRVAYYTCASCYSVRAIGDEYIDPITKEYYCKACVNKKYNTSIQEHNLKPIPKWFGKGTSLYMGFELEAEMENVSSVDVIKYLHENELCKELFYYKHDGSLMNGIEIVSHPFAFQWLKENSNIIKHLHGLTSRGCKSYHTKTCGFHVHMTKSAFTSIQLFKFMKLFYENPDFIRYVSQRRSPERMDNYATLEGGNLYERAKSKSNPREARRGAVNTAPKNTVEVRIFQGNLSETRIWKNLEFCYGVYEFSNVIDIPSITADNFKAFISKTPKVYKNLIAFLDNQKVEED